MTSTGIATIAVTIIIVTVVLMSAAAKRYDKYFTGLWVGDPGFMKKAQLSDLQLFIAPREDGSRQGYLIMTDNDGNFVSNQAIEIDGGQAPLLSSFKASLSGEKDICNLRTLNISYDVEPPPMPKEMKASLSILDGSLTLYSEEKIFAFLMKDLASTAAAVEAYAQ